MGNGITFPGSRDNRLKRIFHNYKTWEDHEHGMYENRNDEEMIKKSSELLKDLDKLYDKMSYVSKNWTYSSEHNLSNPSMNHQAWLGHAACSYNHGATEKESVAAWWTLNKEEQVKANAVADLVDDEWRAVHA